MQGVKLDERLEKDTYYLGELAGVCLLLSRNASFPWFILVPDTRETEFYRLKHDTQENLLDLINRLSGFIEQHFSVNKLNIATIGNVVSQMHIHIVGRTVSDPCWPGVVWGCDCFRAYTDEQLKQIIENLKEVFTDDLQLSD